MAESIYVHNQKYKIFLNIFHIQGMLLHFMSIRQQMQQMNANILRCFFKEWMKVGIRFYVWPKYLTIILKMSQKCA